MKATDLHPAVVLDGLGRGFTRAAIKAAMAALAGGWLGVPAESVLPLDEVSEAFDRVSECQVLGKIVPDLSQAS